MGDSKDDRVVGVGLGLLGKWGHLVFVLGLCRVDPRVVDIDLGVVAGEFADDVNHLGVAQVWAAFLEGEAQHQDS